MGQRESARIRRERKTVRVMIAMYCRSHHGEEGLCDACADLAGYAMIPRRPLALDYRKARLYTNPPPASGGLLVAFGLRLLGGVEFGAPAYGSPEHMDRLARVLALTQEARLAACARGSTAHPDDALLLDPEFLARYRRLLAGQAPARRGTTHISVIDGRGNVASLSVSNGEGSGCIAPGIWPGDI